MVRICRAFPVIHWLAVDRKASALIVLIVKEVGCNGILGSVVASGFGVGAALWFVNFALRLWRCWMGETF